MVNVGNPIVLIADTKYAEKILRSWPSFLSIYLRAVNMLARTSLWKALCRVPAFLPRMGWQAVLQGDRSVDLQKHPVFNLKQQLALFDDSRE